MQRIFLVLLLLTTSRVSPRLHAAATDDARAQLVAGHTEAAIKILREEMAQHPNLFRANALLADILLHEERFAEADQVINAALATHPTAALLHCLRGDLVFREGQVFEAEKEYRTALNLDGKNARGLFGVARCIQTGGLRRSAADLVRTAHNLNPNDPEITDAFDRIEGNSPAAVERWKSELAHREPARTEFADHLKRSIAVAEALNGAPEFELASPYAHYQIAMTLLMDGRRTYGVGLNLSLNGVKTELHLDTGASGMLIGSRLAERARVRRLADANIGGIGNEAPRKGWIGYAEKIRIGDLEFKNCIVKVSDRPSAAGAGGLVGTDIFQRFLIKLNFETHRVELDPLPGPAWDGVTPVDRYAGPELKDFAQVLLIHHYLLLPTRISEDKDSDVTPGLFLVDSGASFSSISTTVAPDLTKVRDSQYMRVKGLNGTVAKVYEADKLNLLFAGFSQKNLGLTTFDLTNISRSAGTEVMGILGLPVQVLFASITIDYRDGRIRFLYKG